MTLKKVEHDLAIQSKKWTPARVFRGSAGSSLLTQTQLELRFDHAAAVDAVSQDPTMAELLSVDLIENLKLFELQSCADSKESYLRNPPAGRCLSLRSKEVLSELGVPSCDVQIMVGDGLSAAAIKTQIPDLLPALILALRARGFSVGRSFYVHYCRVGVLNDIGEILAPKVAILLIGERPGLSTAESLSAYMAYNPNSLHTDANRNLISNIHGRGVALPDAVRRIGGMVELMLRLKTSGVGVKEDALSVCWPVIGSDHSGR